MSRIALIPLHAPHPQNARRISRFHALGQGAGAAGAAISDRPRCVTTSRSPDLIVDGDDARRIWVGPALLDLERSTRRGLLNAGMSLPRAWHPGGGRPVIGRA
jgi:hypothetical protein